MLDIQYVEDSEKSIEKSKGNENIGQEANRASRIAERS
jgi:hypothetical protein